MEFSPEERYVPFRARPSGALTLPDIERMVLSSTPGPALVGVIDGDLAGIVTRRPDVRLSHGFVGIGPPARLDSIERSFALASRAMDIAVRLGMAGAFDFEDLPIHTVVASEDLVGDLLVERHLKPVERIGPKGALLIETVTRFLREGQDVERTASAPRGLQGRCACRRALLPGRRGTGTRRLA